MSGSGRVSTPELSNERIEELSALRSLIEVELASRALPRAHLALIERLKAINGMVGTAVSEYDAVAYIRTNLEFHRTLYLRAQAPAMLAMVSLVTTVRQCALYDACNARTPIFKQSCLHWQLGMN